MKSKKNMHRKNVLVPKEWKSCLNRWCYLFTNIPTYIPFWKSPSKNYNVSTKAFHIQLHFAHFLVTFVQLLEQSQFFMVTFTENSSQTTRPSDRTGYCFSIAHLHLKLKKRTEKLFRLSYNTNTWKRSLKSVKFWLIFTLSITSTSTLLTTVWVYCIITETVWFPFSLYIVPCNAVFIENTSSACKLKSITIIRNNIRDDIDQCVHSTLISSTKWT